MKLSISKNSIFSISGALLMILIWEIISRIVNSRNILPDPWLTLKTLLDLISESSFYLSLGITMLRGLLGFFIAFIFSFLIGVPSGMNRKVESFFSPFIVTIRATPVISIILLAIIWLKVDHVPVFIGFLTMFPILTTSLTSGIKEVDKGLLTMAKIYRVKTWRIFSDVYIPTMFPFLFGGLLTAVGFGWRAVIIGEVLSQPRFGIGSMMQNAQSYLLVAELISWTLVAVLIGFIFEKALTLFEKKVIVWK